eukprot:875866-Amphidinium_carterae.1
MGMKNLVAAYWQQAKKPRGEHAFGPSMTGVLGGQSFTGFALSDPSETLQPKDAIPMIEPYM